MSTDVRYGSAAGRWVLAATVLGSGIVFLDGTVVNVALPAIARDLDAGVSGLQWIVDSYLVVLTALLLLGGSLGDLYGRRRVFIAGLVVFTAASVLCGLAPTTGVLVAARSLQGLGGALLVPGSLAILSAVFPADDRPKAIGAWSGLASASTAIAPFLGGWLIDSVSWRFVFLINVPLAVVAIVIALKHVPETSDADAAKRPDWLGAAAISIGLAAVAYALIERRWAALGIGLVAIGAFVAIERSAKSPMLPLGIFRSTQFTGANLTTFAVYGGLGGAMFLVVLQLQLVLGYSALEAGSSLLPVTILLLLLSSRAGALATRIGPRLPMTLGPIVVAGGLALFALVDSGDSYLTSVLPPAIVFGLGLTLTVAPLTSTVLASVDEHHVGVASGTNNAVSRAAGLVAVAVLPAIGGIDTTSSKAAFTSGYAKGMIVTAIACAVGGLIALFTIRDCLPGRARPTLLQPCQPALRSR